MTTIDVDAVLEGRWLLDHPFYRRWEQGLLADGELASYAAQYAHWERQLPATLGEIAEGAGPGQVRAMVAANLADELSNPAPHTELLDGFCRAVGAREEAPTPPTKALVSLYASAPARSTAFALGVLAAYEVQAGAIAATKADGLRTHYGVDGDGAAFWDVHAAIEQDHADWTMSAAESVDEGEFLAGMAASRDAWWGFLDEREAVAA